MWDIGSFKSSFLPPLHKDRPSGEKKVHNNYICLKLLDPAKIKKVTDTYISVGIKKQNLNKHINKKEFLKPHQQGIHVVQFKISSAACIMLTIFVRCSRHQQVFLSTTIHGFEGGG